MKFRRICDLIRISILLIFSINVALANVSIRTSNLKDSGTIYVALDFKLENGQHITKQEGQGSNFGINWKNAKILSEIWPAENKHASIERKEKIYEGNFTVYYKLKAENATEPVEYDLFYVICGDTCMPMQESGEIRPNNLLLDDEINRTIETEKTHVNLALMILFGLIGGLILNFMPCVFPIISLKIFTIAKIAHQKSKSIRMQALAFSGGIFTVFLTLGSILCFFKSRFPGIGWGFYMQNPSFVFALLLVFLVCAIHFLEIYQFKMPSLNVRKTNGQNYYVTSYISGIFSGIASSSCVGPFAGVALAGAILYGNFIQSSFILLSLCLGLAMPFLLITIFPGIVRKFPTPGNWLNVFKNVMGYAMLLSCVWPFAILLKQIPNANVITLLVISITLVFCFWLLTHFQKNKKFKIVTLMGMVVLTAVGFSKTIIQLEEQKIGWISYSDELFEEAQEKQQPIFLNFTATWCLNCQYNQRIFSDPEVIKAFEENNVVAIKCDWTNQDDKITKLMEKYDSVAVPLYVYYPGHSSEFEILPTILTKTKVIDLIRGIK